MIQRSKAAEMGLTPQQYRDMRVDVAKQMKEEGHSVAEIAATLGTGKTAVYDMLNDRPRRARFSSGETLQERREKRDKEIVDLHKQGMQGVQLAERFNITPQGIHRVLRLAGLTRRYKCRA